jgi:iron complex transport system ATP-binding protein
MTLTVRGLEFAYPHRLVLQGIDLEISDGQMLAVLGTNGAGKTTLLRCLDRILVPSGGSIFLDQLDTAGLSGKEIATKFAYVPQRQTAFRRRVLDAVLLGRRPHIRWDTSQDDIDRTIAVLESLNLTSLANRHTDELSGGELQKVAVARALVQDPQVLLLDEPTSNLDLRNQVDVLSVIRDAALTRRVAVILTIHDLNLAIRNADRFLFLADGQVRAAGGTEILNAGMIGDVYGIPVSMGRIDGFPVVLPAISAQGQR